MKIKSLFLNKSKFFVFLFLFVLTICLIEVIFSIAGYKIVFQTDYSVNFRIGIMTKIAPEKIKKGDYVGFKFLAVPGDPRYGWLFVKRATCMPGEYVVYSIEDNTFYCNGTAVAKPKPYSKTGQRLYPFTYAGVVPEGKLFVTGETYHSYDSRYWGFIDKDWIVGKVYKLF